MTKLKLCLTIPLLPFILLLAGCQKPSTHMPKSSLTEPHPAHWVSSKESLDKINLGQTAFLPLYDGFMSISSRLHLIHQAKYNLDLQYYIWKDDFIGNLMLAELLKAADRGVKVRLLIDDQNGVQLDDKLQALAQHPNMDIQLYNPYQFRHFRVLDYAFRFKHINHRMHNKLIVADGVVAITGGRNISSEYFDASYQFQFSDVDIIFAGTAVKTANQSFHLFWNDQASYPIQNIVSTSKKQLTLASLRQKYLTTPNTEQHLKRRIEMAEKEIAKQLEQHPIRWAKAHFVADHPNKIRNKAQDSEQIYHQMLSLMGEPKEHLELVSAYFVPTEWGANYLSQRAQNGIDIRILTNSFLANDVPVVHAFYQKYRQQLLKNGIKLWEFKPYIDRPERTWYERMTGNIIPAKNKNTSSLHAKFFDIDGMVFIGSFNFDPRSAHLNTEVGLVVESDQLQNEISQNLNLYLPQIAYELKLDDQGQIIWLEHQTNGTIKTHQTEPETTKFQRWMINLVANTPFEWLM
jgi:cardiolipin synthase C